jgi:phosphoribosylamine-glycine ligase
MIGRNRSFITSLERAMPDTELYVLEEPDLHERHIKTPFHSKILRETRVGTYQQSDGLVDVAKQWNDEIGFDVVLPGVEYAVMGAGLVAKELGLRYLGEKAVLCLTNKLRLRELCKHYNIPHPRFMRVESVQDVHNFFNGKPIVIKPANRQASAGVIKIEQSHEIENAFFEMITTDEGHKIANRSMKWEYMAEDYMEGFEVSVESIVQNGSAIFHNITGKITTKGRYFVELGHVVPAILSLEQKEELYKNQNLLISALEAKDGILHAEWKITEEGPKLIECAGRVAGDSILDLIELAYGFNVYATYVKILSGQIVNVPQKPSQGACIRFFEPSPGILKEIRGTEIFHQSDPHLIEYKLTVEPGDTITPINSSWARVGHVIVTGKDEYEAQEKAEIMVNNIQFYTQNS